MRNWIYLCLWNWIYNAYKYFHKQDLFLNHTLMVPQRHAVNPNFATSKELKTAYSARKKADALAESLAESGAVLTKQRVPKSGKIVPVRKVVKSRGRVEKGKGLASGGSSPVSDPTNTSGAGPTNANDPRPTAQPDFSKLPQDYLLSILHDKFGKPAFRAGQEEIIRAAIEGHDVLVVLPTGHGKSLTYQFPAVVDMQEAAAVVSALAPTPNPSGTLNQSGPSHPPTISTGVTIVISPLLSLMHNQVANLANHKIHAASLNGHTSPAARRRILLDLAAPRAHLYADRVARPTTQLLYVSPELCAGPAFRALLTRLAASRALRRFVIDEAHCCVEWAFRAAYSRLSELRVEFKEVPITALTATAAPAVRDRITGMLGMRQIKVFETTINRPNLHYEVAYLPAHDVENDIVPKIVLFLEKYRERRMRTALSQHTQPADGPPEWLAAREPSTGAGIVYCRKRETVDAVAELLRAAGFGAHAYHAGLPAVQRDDVLARWAAGAAGHEVVVATVAFGMGIDKADVRFVVHVDLPGSVESYCQQAGRAGRDGKGARCVLFYSIEDRNRVVALQEKGEEVPAGLRWLIKYCETRDACRHLLLAKYFDKSVPDIVTPEWCEYACDYCKDPRAVMRRSAVLM